MTDKFDLAAMKRDMERPRLTKDWKVISDVPAPGWVQVVGPAFRVAGPTTATDLNGEDYMDRHRDARRIARVPEMEAEILRLREGLDAIRQYGSDTLDGPSEGTPDDREWQRAGVLEMTDRADRVLSGEPWKKEALSHD